MKLAPLLTVRVLLSVVISAMPPAIQDKPRSERENNKSKYLSDKELQRLAIKQSDKMIKSDKMIRVTK